MEFKIEKLIEIVRNNDCTIRRKVMPKCTDEELLTLFYTVGRELVPNFTIDADNRNCILNMMKWLMGDSTLKAIDPMTKKITDGRFRNTGIYLYGTTGTGKTLAMKILLQLSLAMKLIYVSNATEYPLRWKTIRADEIVDKYIHGDSLHDIKNVDILCINDLGAEVKDALYMGTRMNVMRNLLEQRGESSKVMTLITSNIPLDSPDLSQMYGDRVVSRLVNMCNFMVLKGPDRRKRR